LAGVLNGTTGEHLEPNPPLPFSAFFMRLPASPMRKLTEEELRAMTLVGRGRQSEYTRALLGLAVGEALFLSKHEWKKNYHPSNTARRVGKTHSRKFELLAEVNGTGWVVKRVG